MLYADCMVTPWDLRGVLTVRPKLSFGLVIIHSGYQKLSFWYEHLSDIYLCTLILIMDIFIL